MSSRKQLTLEDINFILSSYPLREQLEKVLASVQKAKEAGINFSKVFRTSDENKILNQIRIMTIVALLELMKKVSLGVFGNRMLKPINCSLNWDTNKQNIWVECKVIGQAFEWDINIPYKVSYITLDNLEYDVLVKTEPVPPEEALPINLPQLLYKTIAYPPHSPKYNRE